MRKYAAQIAAVSAILIGSASFAAADPIEGTWKRPESKGGTLEIIAKCADAFCVTVGSGDYNGKKAGSFKKNADGTYSGKLTEMKTGISFSGTGTVTGNTFTMKAFGGFVKEDWARQ